MHTDTLTPIRSAGLLVTTWCPARCRHCYVCAGPERSAWMTVDEARGHLAALARLGAAAEGIHLTGGEPFGDGDRLLAIVASAREAGLDGVGFVETCGHWATSDALVRDRLEALRDAGMRQISISTDPYHQEFVPPDRVRRLYDVAREVLGPRGVRARRWTWLKDPRDVAAMPEADRERLFADFLQRYLERIVGRAAAELASLLPRHPIDDLPDDGCHDALLGCGHVHVLPGGWVYPGTCAGLVLGRADGEGGGTPLDAVLGAWRPADAPHVARLAEGGPKAVLAHAEARGFAPDPEGYAGKCHLCWSVRRFLLQAGAGAPDLGPPEMYQP